MIDWKVSRTKNRYMIGGGFYADSDIGRFLIERITGGWALSAKGRWVGNYDSAAGAKAAAIIERLRIKAAI
jgi:hypothetical protein